MCENHALVFQKYDLSNRDILRTFRLHTLCLGIFVEIVMRLSLGS